MDREQITQILQDWQDGDARAADALMPLIYNDLKRIARSRMRGEGEGHTLQTTALVHEAYLRAIGLGTPVANRAHFLALISRIMRRVLVDHARSRGREKRGGPMRPMSIDDLTTVVSMDDPAVLEIDDALRQLGLIDSRKEDIIVAHYFGGLERQEIAEALDLSLATVDRDLRFSRAWLNKTLAAEAG